MSTNNIEALAAEFVQAYNNKDFARLREMISPNFYFQHHNREFEIKDPDEFVALLTQFASELLPERSYGKPNRITSTGNTVVVEHPWSGTPTADVPGMGNAGEKISLDLCTVMIFEDNLVAQYHDYG